MRNSKGAKFNKVKLGVEHVTGGLLRESFVPKWMFRYVRIKE